MRENRRILPLLLLALILCTAARAQSLQAHLQGDRLQVAEPRLHFLAGKVLERLHNGAAVPIHFQLTAAHASGGKVISQVSGRFVVSFDLWEERFSIVRMDEPKRAVSHLSSSAVEALCLENMALPVSALAGVKSFMLKLEVWAEESGEPSSENGPDLSIAGLIDVFSRKPKDPPSHWSAVSDPLRPEDLKQKATKTR